MRQTALAVTCRVLRIVVLVVVLVVRVQVQVEAALPSFLGIDINLLLHSKYSGGETSEQRHQFLIL